MVSAINSLESAAGRPDVSQVTDQCHRARSVTESSCRGRGADLRSTREESNHRTHLARALGCLVWWERRDLSGPIADARGCDRHGVSCGYADGIGSGKLRRRVACLRRFRMYEPDRHNPPGDRALLGIVHEQ